MKKLDVMSLSLSLLPPAQSSMTISYEETYISSSMSASTYTDSLYSYWVSWLAQFYSSIPHPASVSKQTYLGSDYILQIPTLWG